MDCFSLNPMESGKPFRVFEKGPCGHSMISAFRLSRLIKEAYLNQLYSEQLITLPVHTTFNSSRTKENNY